MDQLTPKYFVMENISLSINDELANNTLNNHNLVAWLHHLLFKMPETYKLSQNLTMAIYNTLGEYDTITHFAANSGDDITDHGGHARTVFFC